MSPEKRVFATTAREGVFSLVEKVSSDSQGSVHILDAFISPPPGRLARGLLPGAGVSVAYGGLGNEQAMESLTLREERRDETDSAHPRRSIRLEGEVTGLRLTVEYTHYPKHHAVLVSAELENTGSQPIRHVKELRSFELAFDVDVTGDTIVHTIGGGVTHFFFPPLAFQLDERRFMGSVRHPLRIDSGGTGRSSDRYLPFFFVEDGWRESGLYAGLEWSGLWHIDFTRVNETFFIRGGIEDVDLTLRPGERVAMPRALVGFYQGSIAAGRNALRHFIGDWLPRYQGKDLDAPVYWNHAFTFGATINEDIFRRQVPVCADLGIEWMQIDWGWYAGCIPPRNCIHGIGNWTKVDPDRFPNGIKPLADLVRSKGMNFCTWFDPEQAHPSSLVAKEHPEWMLYVEDREMGLVDFGRRDVQDWFIDVIQQRIDEWGIHKLKWDNNIDPRPYWLAHEDPEHRGLMQMNHIRGVYRVWEELTRRNPQLVLENCSSGGRRFDLGTFARAHIHHGSDFNFQNDIVRNQISGINTVMPTHRVIHTCTWGGPDSPDVYYQSRFGGILRFSQDFASWPSEALERARRHITVYKSIRHLLKADFYPLFPQPRSLEAWDGWQFHNPASGEGFVIAFRSRSPEATQRPRLQGLQPEATYVFMDPYSGEELVLQGRSLVEDGLTFNLEPDTARLWHYKVRPTKT